MPRDGSGPIEASEPRPAANDESAGLAHSLSPVDLPDPPVPLPHGLKWTTMVIAWASLVLLLLNAHALRAWSYQLAPNAASARIVTLAETWYDVTDQAGLNQPVEAMHGWWQRAKDAHFRDDSNVRSNDQSVGRPSAEGVGG
jgi:hypothetical protein